MTTPAKLDTVKKIKSQIKQAIINKGVAFDGTETFADYADMISEIGPDLEPATINITQDGTYDVTNYTSAVVNNTSAIGIPMKVTDGVYGRRGGTFILPSNVTNLGSNVLRGVDLGDYKEIYSSVDLSSLTSVSGAYALYHAFHKYSNLTSVDLSSLTSVSGAYAMQNAFAGCTSLTSVNLSSLTSVSGGESTMDSTFAACTSLPAIDLSSLTSVSGTRAMYRWFYNCYDLTSVDLSSLTSVSGAYAMQNAFAGCTSLTSVNLSSLTSVSGSGTMSSIFQNCSNLASVSFPKLEVIGMNTSSENSSQFSTAFSSTAITTLTFPELTEIYCNGSGSSSYGTFYNNNTIQKMYFPKLNTITYGNGASSDYQNACKYIFSNCSALIELHFGASNQSAIEASSGYSTAWGRGAGNVTIYFDL